MPAQHRSKISEEDRRLKSAIFGQQSELAAFNLQKGSGGADENILRLGSDALSSSTGVAMRVVYITGLRSVYGATYALLKGCAIATEESRTTVASVPERLIGIKAAFGLNMSQLASVLRVSRQTVYNWEDGGEMLDENRARLTLLEHLAGEWKARCGWTAQKYLNTPIGKTGTTLLSLLSADDLDVAEAKTAIRAVADKVNETRAKETGREPSRNAPEAGRIGMLAPYTASHLAKGDE